MESPSIHLTRRLATVAGLVALLLLVPAAGSWAASATRQVQVLDDCDPATFNAAIGPGTCVKDGTTTFSEFIAQLLAQGRAPAWRFAPAQLRLDAGGTLQANNRGGEDHTFTEVATFGGGCIQALNDLLGADPGAGVCGVSPRGLRSDAGSARGHGDDLVAAAGYPPLRVPHPSLDAVDRDRRLRIGTGARAPVLPLAQRTRSTTSSQHRSCRRDLEETPRISRGGPHA
jgi:hypothetical protein